ncbi:MAG TPA: DNRLRE domain-containing protein [Candidatus Saccharimonadales bacterium]|nr:DNRLRE domain-containing protein [Candidatus Saccharimonadales bacterium]
MLFSKCFWAGARVFLATLVPLSAAYADTAVLRPKADTTLIQTQPDNNSGGQAFANAGTTQNYTQTRALFRFDTSSLPANALVNSVSLTFEVVRQPRDGFNPSLFGVHRMLQSWGEGNKTQVDENNPGLGEPATAGEATWNARFFGSQLWATPGGAAGIDYAAGTSSTMNVYGTGDSPYTFPSEDGIVEDVQYWLAHPDLNFGWMLKAENEDDNFTARRFASREDPNDFGPVLQIDYTVVPEPAFYAIAGSALLAFYGIRRSILQR